MITAKLYAKIELTHNPKDGVIAYYHCDLCDTTTKQQRSPYAIPDRVRCVRCAMNERGI